MLNLRLLNPDMMVVNYEKQKEVRHPTLKKKKKKKVANLAVLKQQSN